MKTGLLIGLLSLWIVSSPFVFGQTSDSVATDSIAKTEKELLQDRVDSLVKHTRKEFYKNNYDIAIEVGEKTLALAKQIGDNKAIFRTSSLMGNAFLKIEDTLQAKRIFNETLKLAEDTRDSLSIITAQIDLGNYYALRNYPEPALELYKQSIPLAKKLEDSTHLFILNFNITELLLDDKKIETAQYYLNETKRYGQNLKAKIYKAGVYLLEGRRFYLSNKYHLAIDRLKKCIAISEETGFTDGLIEGYDLYAKAESKLGNHDKAFDLIQESYIYKDEKYKKDKIEAVETVTARFKLDQYKQELNAQAKQAEFDQLVAKRETRVIWISVALGILFFFSIFLFISDQKRKKLLRDLIEKNTQYLRAKEKSEALSREKGLLFANITHELRTPMYGIIGISSILMQDKKLNSHSENLASLKFSANYLLALINNVLQLTKIDSTRKDVLEKVEFDLEELIQNAVSATKYIDSRHPNSYDISLGNDIPKRLLGDELKLSQVFMNLIGNSAKFTKNGHIAIAVNRIPSEGHKIRLQFEISDTGKGIPKEKLELIFNEFADSGSDKSYSGMGLGLPIVKKILDLHNSTIKVESEEGKGSKVSFIIDFDPMIKPLNGATSTEVLDTSELQNKRILVVDDNKINQIVTSKILKGFNVQVSVASSGPEAIDLARREPLDLILMDINMPVMNGFDTTERIRAFNTQIPIIALTAVEIEKVTESSSFELMDDFIIKPYHKERFVETISKHLATVKV